MDEGELAEAGFQWQPEATHEGSVVGGVIAALPGSLVHGMGHYYMKDPQAGIDLITLEFLFAAPLIVVGGVIYATADSGAVGNTGLLVLQTGGALFSTSYAADVIGVFKGTEDDLPDVSRRLDGLRTRSGYTFLMADDLPCNATQPCHLIDVGLEADLGSVFLYPYTRLDLAGEYEELGLDMEWRTVPGQTSQEYWGLGLSLSQVSFGVLPEVDIIRGSESGITVDSVIRFEASLNLNLDLSTLLTHLDNVLAQTSGGVGVAFEGGSRAVVPGGDGQNTYVFLKHALLFNLFPELMLRPYYVFSEAEPVAPLTTWAGTFGAEVVWAPLHDLDVYVDGLVGSGVSITSGVRYAFWP